MKKRSLIFDIPNIAYEVAAVNKSNAFETDTSTLSGLCMHILFQRIQKYFKQYNPDHIVFAFENKNNWRKAWTQSESSVSKIKYKGNRVYDSSMQYYFNMLDAFKETCTHHTSIICLSTEGIEGDDMIAGYTQLYANDDHEVIILSGDKDFIQLLKNPNVKLVNQRDGKLRNQPGDKLYWDDLNYFIFEKCMRGDKKDNVFSAKPGVRKTQLEKAFKDEYEWVKLMNETWFGEINGEKIEFKVGDLYKENQILLDLTKQPEEIREYMFDYIKNTVNNIEKFSLFNVQKFLGQYKLNKISETLPNFIDIFNRNYETKKGIFSSDKKQDSKVEDNKPKLTNTNLLSF